MKMNIKKNIIVLLTALFFASCNNLGMNTGNEDQFIKEGYGSVCISINQGRTAYPLLKEAEFDDWNWIFEYKENAESTDWIALKKWDAAEGANIATKFSSPTPVEPGKKYFRVRANKVSEEKLLTQYTSGIVEHTIVAGEPTQTLLFTLALTQIDSSVEGTGDAKITLNCSITSVSRITWTLFNAPTFASEDDDENLTVANAGGELSPSAGNPGKFLLELKDCNTGNYVVAFNFYDAEGNLLNVENSKSEYIYIVKDCLSESEVDVDSLDESYSITYIPAPTIPLAHGCYSRHSDKIDLPCAVNGGNNLDSQSALFCGWYESSDFTGEPCIEIPAGSRGNKVFYGRYISKSENDALPGNLALSYLNNSIDPDEEEELLDLPQVGNTINISGDSISPTCYYQWEEKSDGDWEEISKATETTYKLSAANVGKNIALSITKKYTFTDVPKADEESIILYHKAEANTQSTRILLKASDQSNAIVQKGTLDLTGVNIQYSGKVMAGNMPEQSKLIISGILKDIYDNTINSASLNGGFVSYNPISVSKYLKITVDVEGYTLSEDDSSASVYVPVQKPTPTGVALMNAADAETPLGANNIAFTAETANLIGLEYSVDGGTSWLTPIPNEPFEKPESGTIYVRYAQIGEFGKEGYVYASNSVKLTVSAMNIGGNEEAEITVILLSGSQIQALLAQNFRTARHFICTSDSAPSNAITISAPESTVEVKAWKSGTSTTATIYVSAGSYTGKIPLPEDSSEMFKNLTSLRTINLTNFTSEKVTKMKQMFAGCSKLESLNFGEDFDTSLVTDMSYMFQNTQNLKTLELSGFNTSAVTTTEGMFSGSGLTELDLSSFNTSLVENMSEMFAECMDLETINFGSNFSTAEVKNMDGMFKNMVSITELDLSGFITTSAESMAEMFSGAESIEVIDLSTFDTSSVSTMEDMFTGCTSLFKIYVDGDKWSTSDLNGNDVMFEGCESLVGGLGTVYEEFNVDSTYARIDAEGNPGYLTEF